MENQNRQEKIMKFLEMVEKSDYIVFFGGAGVSTESGIPDFRSVDGLYNQQYDYPPETILSHTFYRRNTKEFYRFYRNKMLCLDAKPNMAHKKLAELEEVGKVRAVITQNIDGLHQKAGSKNVYEIHGTTQRNYCHKCKKEYDPNFLFETKESIPKCDCRGLIRPDVVLYGEGLPEKAVEGAINAIRNADMLIIGGTSLQVYPAANFVYDFCGEHLVVVNKEELKITLNQDSDLFICESLGKVFSEIEKCI